MFDMFARVIYDTFSKACRDVGELLYLVERLFPKFIEPAVQGRVLRTQESKLFALFETHMRTALTSLFLRDTASAEWERKLGIGAGALRDPAAAPAAPPAADATEIAGDTERDGQDSRDRNNEVGGADRGNNDEAGDDGDDGDWRLTTAAPVRSAATGDVFELPYYAKFLLIASFLASYNPPRLDRRFFTKQGEGRRARKKAGGDLVQENKKLRQQLLGPKAFPVERMLAIFYSIVDSDLDAGFRVYSAIASLISLRLMLRVSGMDRLDDMRCKCNANYALVHRVAQSVRFDLSKYLFDFVALA
nr:Origin recognition complex subunit 5 [Polyrhizophydium stewartii]